MAPSTPKRPRLRRWKRRVLWTLGTVGLVVLVGYAVMLLLMHRWVAKPPVLAQEPDLVRAQPETRGDRVYLGRNWFGRREGLHVLYLTGSDFEMGYAHGLLTQKLIHQQEQTMLDLFRSVAPYRWTQFLLQFAVIYKNRHLPEFVSAELQLEMLGLSRGSPDVHPELGPPFNRVLSFHAAQDISYMMMNSPLIRQRCTAFGAWGASTKDQHLLTGRNFDWEAAPVFDEQRVVVLCEPDAGIPFVSLAWAGMAGCVSGLNRDGLSVTVNGAPSQLPGDTATPTCLVARQVLQHAHNIAEAETVVRQSRVFVSALFLVGSRADGRFVVIEKTPDQTATRAPGDDPWIICANHYLTPALVNTPINAEFRRDDTSQSRYDRAEELVRRTTGSLDPPRTAEILRDRQLPGDRFPGNGHRSTLNPLIATHAVIMDLSAGIFWAANSPHQLGSFVAFDVAHFERELPAPTLPADPILASGEFERYRNAEAQLAAGRAALKRRDLAAALAAVRAAMTNNPGCYRNDWLEAEVFAAQGQPSAAAASARRALDGQPALAAERRKIQRLVPASTTGGSGNGVATPPPP